MTSIWEHPFWMCSAALFPRRNAIMGFQHSHLWNALSGETSNTHVGHEPESRIKQRSLIAKPFNIGQTEARFSCSHSHCPNVRSLDDNRDHVDYLNCSTTSLAYFCRETNPTAKRSPTCAAEAYLANQLHCSTFCLLVPGSTMKIKACLIAGISEHNPYKESAVLSQSSFEHIPL